jgi:hypothetical protein
MLFPLLGLKVDGVIVKRGNTLIKFIYLILSIVFNYHNAHYSTNIGKPARYCKITHKAALFLPAQYYCTVATAV